MVIVGGTSCRRLGDDARTALRRTAIGFVYQFHHLLPEFSALENIVVPQMIAAAAKSAARDRAGSAWNGRPRRPGNASSCKAVGRRAAARRHRPRACQRSDVLIADEPTGNLDQETADRVFALLVQLTRETGVAALMATHNPDLAARMDRKLTLRNGVLEEI